MPGRDGTGPTGLGPNMGRGPGRRAGVQAGLSGGGILGGFGQPQSCRGRGLRMGDQSLNQAGFIGRGAWQGLQQPFNQSTNSRSELDYLKDYASNLEESLNAIKARIAEMQKRQGTAQASE